MAAPYLRVHMCACVRMHSVCEPACLCVCLWVWVSKHVREFLVQEVQVDVCAIAWWMCVRWHGGCVCDGMVDVCAIAWWMCVRSRTSV